MREEIQALFAGKHPLIQQLLAHGFTWQEQSKAYVHHTPLLKGEMTLCLSISEGEEQPRWEVLDGETGEPYMLIKVESAAGGFLGDVRTACLSVLTELAECCYEVDRYKAEQTARMLRFLEEECGVLPEYPWKGDGSAVFRHGYNQKWFALLMRIPGKRLDASLAGEVEVVNLKAAPANIAQWIARGESYPAYHMNKIHWHTVLLDGHLCDEVLFSRITESFLLTK